MPCLQTHHRRVRPSAYSLVPHTVSSRRGAALGPGEAMRHTHQQDNSKYISQKKQAGPSVNHLLATCTPYVVFKNSATKPKPCRATQGGAAMPKHTDAAGSAHFLPTVSAASAAPAEPLPRRPLVSHRSQGGEGQWS